MKRSKFAGLALMGAAPFFLSACDQQPRVGGSTAAAYRSVEECVADGVFTQNACATGFASARESAPRYANRNECEESYGNCEQVVTREGGSVFMPAMMGFMMGQMLSGGSRMAYHQPIYQDRHNRGDWGRAVRQAESRLPKGMTAAQKAPARARSGFGSGAAARGGWGS